jgi:hypothetical protein
MKIKLLKDDGSPKGAWVAVLATIAWLLFSWGFGVVCIVVGGEFTAAIAFYGIYSGTTVTLVGAYFLKKYGDGKNGKSYIETNFSGGRTLDFDSRSGDDSGPQNITAKITE